MLNFIFSRLFGNNNFSVVWYQGVSLLFISYMKLSVTTIYKTNPFGGSIHPVVFWILGKKKSSVFHFKSGKPDYFSGLSYRLW